jgi:hypothetical protein
MGDYMPRTDATFDSWLNNFKAQFSTLAATLGFSPADVLTVTSAYTTWHGSFDDHIEAQNAAKGAAATKNGNRDAAMATVRSFVKQIQSNPDCTDAMRAQLGITIPDGQRTPSQSPTESPNLLLDWSQRGRVTIHVGTIPSNEALNKFGEYAKNVLLQFKNGTGDWEFLAVCSSSPFTHIVGNESPVTVEYRAAYLNSKGVQGPWSDTDSAYVGAAA